MSKKNLSKILGIDKEFRLVEVKEIDEKKVVAHVERKKKIKCRQCGSRNKTTVHDKAKKSRCDSIQPLETVKMSILNISVIGTDATNTDQNLWITGLECKDTGGLRETW